MYTIKKKIQKQAYEAWRNTGRTGILFLPPGAGKSAIMAKAINTTKIKRSDYDIPYLILTSNEELRDYGTPAEMEKFGVKKKFQIECYQTAHRWKGKKIGLVVADEFDFAMTEKYSQFFFNNKWDYDILLSATLNQEKSEIARQISKVCFVTNIQKAQDIGLINKVKLHIHEVPLSEEKYIRVTKNWTASEIKYYRWINNKIESLKETIKEKETTALLSNLVESVKINNEILRLKQVKKYYEYAYHNPTNRASVTYSLKSLTKKAIEIKEKILLDKKNKVLIFARRTEDVDKICNLNTFHGKNEKVRNQTNKIKFNNDDIRELGVVKKVERGISFDNLNHTLGHSFSSSSISFIQGLLGRATRLHPKETAYIHLLVSYYYDADGSKCYCQNKVWLENILNTLNKNYEEIEKTTYKE